MVSSPGISGLPGRRCFDVVASVDAAGRRCSRDDARRDDCDRDNAPGRHFDFDNHGRSPSVVVTEYMRLLCFLFMSGGISPGRRSVDAPLLIDATAPVWPCPVGLISLFNVAPSTLPASVADGF